MAPPTISTFDLLYKSLIKPSDFFLSGIVNFVKSNLFLYVPLNNEKHIKIKGAIEGGSKLIYKSGNLRSGNTSCKNINLKSLISCIKSLSQAEQDELKQQL